MIRDSEQGCQHTSNAFGLRSREVGVRPSVGSVGDWHDLWTHKLGAMR